MHAPNSNCANLLAIAFALKNICAKFFDFTAPTCLDTCRGFKRSHLPLISFEVSFNFLPI